MEKNEDNEGSIQSDSTRAKMVDIQFGSRKIKALLDTGADLCLLNFKIFKSIPKRFIVSVEKDSSPSVVGVTGHSLSPFGYVTLKLKLGHHISIQKFLVIKNMRKAAILGADFLIKNHACIDFRRKTLILQPGSIGIVLKNKECEDEKCYLVNGAKTVNIPPRTMMKIPIKIPRKAKSTACMVQPLDTSPVFQNQPGLSVPVSLLHDERKLLVVNETNRSFHIRKNTPLAIAEELTEEEIDAIETQEVHETYADDSDLLKTYADDSDPLKMNILPSRWNRLKAKIKCTMENEIYKEKLYQLLEKYQHLFAESDLELGRTNTVEMKLDTGDSHPIRSKPYRTPLAQRSLVEDHVKQMMDAKVISPSTSPWASPIVIVPKKDGTKRFCIDYRKLNQSLRFNSYPLPNIVDIWPNLKGAKFFTTLDLKSGYWQIPMEEGSKEKTAFVTNQGLYQFNVMPFGLSTAPPIFQEMMDKVLGEAKHVYAMAYLDDVLIWSKTFEEHLYHMEQIFKKLENAGLKLKISKCDFLLQQIKYLGHVISEEGIQPDPDKVSAIKSMSAPKDVTGIRSFLGMTSYYRSFIPNHAHIAKPLTVLTKKNATYHWGDEEEEAFQQLKNALVTAPILGYADPTLEYSLHCDASGSAVGAMLTQVQDGKRRVIHYLSHQLSSSQQKWPTIEREMYAIIYAISKLRHFLLDAKFTIYTDHAPLKHLFTAEMKNARIQRWAIMLDEYNCSIEYTSGKSNTCADLLSRLPANDEVFHDDIEIDIIDSTTLDKRQRCAEVDRIPHVDVENIDPLQQITCARDLIELQHNDEEFKTLIDDLLQGKSTKENRHFILQNDLLYHLSTPVKRDQEPRLQLVIPHVLRKAVLHEIHSNDFSAHVGSEKTYDRLRTRYFWSNMYKDVVEFIDKCDVCRSRHMKATKAPLQRMPIPSYPFEIIGIDTCGPYPETSDGYKYVVTVTCHLTSYPMAIPVKDKTAITMASVLAEEIIPTHSCPRTIISDKGTEYCNTVIDHLSVKMGINHITTSPYHPQSNGKAERFHRYMVDSLAKLMLYDPDQTSWN